MPAFGFGFGMWPPSSGAGAVPLSPAIRDRTGVLILDRAGATILLRT